MSREERRAEGKAPWLGGFEQPNKGSWALGEMLSMGSFELRSLNWRAGMQEERGGERGGGREGSRW